MKSLQTLRSGSSLLAALAISLAGVALASPTNAAPATLHQTQSGQQANTLRTCQTGRWSDTMKGRPTSLAAGSKLGAYLWHDDAGWHLRVTHPATDQVVVTGVIQSSRTITGAARATESNDTVKINRERERIRFEFNNYGHIDGIDFHVGCSNLFTLSMQINGVPISTAQVFLGSNGVNALSTPIVVERT